MADEAEGTKRYVRMYFEMEIEVTDMTAIKAEELTMSVDQDGDSGLFADPSDDWTVYQAVTHAMLRNMNSEPHDGWRFMSGGGFPRTLTDGGWWEEVTLGAMPGRTPSGELISPPGQEDLWNAG